MSSPLYQDTLVMFKKEKSHQTKELIIHNAKNIHRKYSYSDTYICSDKCPYTGDKWFMLKHPCKNFYKHKQEKEKQILKWFKQKLNQ